MEQKIIRRMTLNTTGSISTDKEIEKKQQQQ
jgi:hypothetical protein